MADLAARRTCAEPGCERYFIPKSTRPRFCLEHRKTKPRDPMHYRKYGPVHRQLRAQWASRVARGTVECARCEPIEPGAAWDLGQVDGGGPREYSGPEHARCNRGTAGRHGAVSRIW
jgi:hypothetical protein